MAAIVRVKRRICEDPADSLLFSCKRPRRNTDTEKEDKGEDEEVKNVFKYAGTVKAEDVCVSQPIRDAIRKEKLQKEHKRHVWHWDRTAKTRAQHRASSETNRYKVVSQNRAPNLEDLDNSDKKGIEVGEKDSTKNKEKADKDENKENVGESEAMGKKFYCLYDVVPEELEAGKSTEKPEGNDENTITCNSVPLEREAVQPAQYVYDLYYLNKRDCDFRLLGDIMIEACKDVNSFDLYRDAEEDIYEDEDDSNDENNWRNDYPEEDPKFFENEDSEDYFGEEGHEFSRAFDLEDNLGGIMDRGLRLGGALYNRNLSSEDEDDDPAYDFSQPLDSSIWAPTTLAASSIWAPTAAGTTEDTSSVWSAKPIESGKLDPSSMWSSQIKESGWPSETVQDDVSKLWAPTADFEQYQAKILQELGADDDDKADLT